MAETATIRVFEVQREEWYAGRNIDEVRAHHLQLTKLPEGEAFDECFHQLSDDELDSLKWIDFDDPDVPPVTFAEHLNDLISLSESFPCHFASGNY